MNWLYALPVLACPVGMGLMMWLMMRPGRSQSPSADPVSGTEIEQLRAEVSRLRQSQFGDYPPHGDGVLLDKR